MPDFNSIPQMTRNAGYHVDIMWDYLPTHYLTSVLDYYLNVSPDFQRDYVWAPEQKVRYVEFILRGGSTGRDIYTNCPEWSAGGRDNYVLVDGKQRLDAVLGFLNNEFPIFGDSYRRDFTGFLRTRASFKWHVNDLKSRDEVLQWYVDLNAGGTIHSPDEIARVRSMIGQGAYRAPSVEETKGLANLDREVLQKAWQDELLYRQKKEHERIEAAAKTQAPKRKARR